MVAGLPGLSGQCVTTDVGEAFKSVQGPAPILPHSTVEPSARARAFRKQLAPLCVQVQYKQYIALDSLAVTSHFRRTLLVTKVSFSLLINPTFQ